MNNDIHHKTQYSVVLSITYGDKTPFVELLESFGNRIAVDDDKGLLHFWCSEIDDSHPVYLKVRPYNPNTQREHSLRVPHRLVFLVSDKPLASSGEKIGFASET